MELMDELGKINALEPGNVDPIRYKITYTIDGGQGDRVAKTVEVEGHFLTFVHTDVVDVYKERSGRLIRFAWFNNVVNVEEIE